MSKGTKINIRALLACASFMLIEIAYDLGSDKYKEDIVLHWYLPLSIFLFILMLCLWQLAENIFIKIAWIFFCAMAGNWIFRFYLGLPYTIQWTEYFWGIVVLICSPLQYRIYKRKKQNTNAG